MTDHLEVELHGTVVGDLVVEGAHASFQFRPSYWSNPERPVLGQWFEDGLSDEIYRGPDSVPAFFANLAPEAGLADWLKRENGLGSGPLELLGVSGDDLPGAVRLIRAEPIHSPPRSIVWRPPSPTPSFGLPGAQLKLPMSLDRDDRLTLPVPGEPVAHFLKLPTRKRYRGIAQNEAATMNWAREAGFRVANCTVRDDPPAVEGATEEVTVGEPCLLVERFDRTPSGSIHQEDLAQAQWLDPEQKYPWAYDDERRFDAGSEQRRARLATTQGIGRYAARLLGTTGAEEFLRRFVFVVASGNGDAHLKNWSLWYPDRKHAEWTPLYDQVSTVAWHHEVLACPLYGTRNFAAIHRSALLRLGRDSGLPEDRADQIATETLGRLRSAWAAATAAVPYPPDHRQRLLHHWRSVPLLREIGELDQQGG